MSGNSKNKCATFQELIDARLDGELAESEAGPLDAHIASCAACAEEYKLALRLRAELQALPGLRCPDTVTERVFAEVAPPAPARMKGFFAGLFATPAGRLRFAAAAAAVVILEED